jgi:YfiH family protein
VPFVQLGDLTCFQFPALAALPWLRHAVSTRLGGVSTGHLATLNLGGRVGDSAEAVTENRRRLLATTGLPPAPWAGAQQVHGTTIARVGPEGGTFHGCDGLVTSAPGVALLILIADCPCLAIVDPVHRAIALGHAGWRGTVAGMAGALVNRLVMEFGAQPDQLLAAISPSIGPCCYEVGEDVVAHLRMARPHDWPALLRPGRHTKPHLDLWETNRRMLIAAGLRPANISVAGICNACQPALFYSHRRDQGRTGRYGMVAGIMPEASPGSKKPAEAFPAGLPEQA